MRQFLEEEVVILFTNYEIIKPFQGMTGSLWCYTECFQRELVKSTGSPQMQLGFLVGIKSILIILSSNLLPQMEMQLD